MKTLLKLGIVVAILIAIFGTATVKGWIHVGTDKLVDGVEYGVNKVKDSEYVQDKISEAKDAAAGAAKDALSNIFSK